MVLTARLYINGHESGNEGIPLDSCSYGFTQDIDQRGLPKSEVKGGVIRFAFNSIDDQEIMHWMISSKADKSGKISFSGEETEKVFKTLEFKDARCISYQEAFTRDIEMVEEITISAREVTISGVTHTNTWSKYDANR
jgi:Hemolysin coregulated protein Hcp (TssD)